MSLIKALEDAAKAYESRIAVPCKRLYIDPQSNKASPLGACYLMHVGRPHNRNPAFIALAVIKWAQHHYGLTWAEIEGVQEGFDHNFRDKEASRLGADLAASLLDKPQAYAKFYMWPLVVVAFLVTLISVLCSIRWWDR